MDDWLNGKDTPTKPQSPWRRLIDSIEDSAYSNSLGLGTVGRIDLVRNKGMSNEDVSKLYRKKKSEIAARRKADEDAWLGVDTLSPANIGKAAVDLVGNIIGGVDPTYLLAPGKTAVQKIIGQGMVNAGADATSQSINIKQKVQDEMDWLSVGVNAAAGVGLQGAAEVGKRVARGRSNKKLVESNKNDDFIMPVRGEITSNYGPRRAPKTGASTNHGGIDIAARVGTPISAPASGTVNKVGRGHAKRGNWVEIDHGDGHTSRYLHLSGFNVKPGQTIEAGSVFGRVGKTGNVTGPHLHYSVYKDGKAIDPRSARFGTRPTPTNDTEIGDRDGPFVERSFDADQEGIDFQNALRGMEDDLDADFRAVDDDLITAAEREDMNEFPLPNEDAEFLRSLRDPNSEGPRNSEDVTDDYEPFDPYHQEDGDYEGFSSDRPENLVDFPVPKGLTPQDIADIYRPRKGLDASAPKPVNRNTGTEDIVGKGSVATTPVNDLRAAFIGDLPKSRLAPAIMHENGRVYVGEENSSHINVIDAHPGLENFAKDSGGFVTPDGRYLTREEAAREVGSPDLGLESVSYNRGTSRTEMDKDVTMIKRPDLARLPDKKNFLKDMKDMLDDDSGSLNIPGAGRPSKGPNGKDYSGLTPLEKIVRVIQDSGPLRKDQEKLYHEERSKRNAMIESVRARGGSAEEIRGVASGELPKVRFDPIAQHFTPEDIKALEQHVIKHKNLRGYETLNVLGSLRGLFDPEGAKLPTPSELDLMNDVFPTALTKALAGKVRNMSGEQLGMELLNTPKALMASVDISAPGRQGLVLAGRPEFWKNVPENFKFMANEDTFQAAMESIKAHDNYPLAKTAALDVKDLGHLRIGDREEAFAANLPEEILSKMQERMPGGKYVPNVYRASDRAYTGFLRKLRFDVFNSLIEKGRLEGINWENNDKQLKALGRFINSATGRGDLKTFGSAFESAAPLLNALLFSPRFIKSRIDFLNPAFYFNLYKQSPFVAKEAMKDGSKFIALQATILGLAVAGGAEVVGDLRSSDSLKIKIGDTRIDTMAGFKPFLTLGARLATGETKTLKGDVRPIGRGESATGDFGEKTALDVAQDFIRTKAAPLPASVMNWLDGKDLVGREFDYTKEGAKLIAPMWIPEFIETLQQTGAKGAWTVLPNLIGFGTSTYDGTIPPDKDKGNNKKDAWMKEDKADKDWLEKKSAKSGEWDF